MDERTELRESHDCGILLQHKIENLPQVERCFVHIDYTHRDADDHDHATPVMRKVHSSHGKPGLSPLPSSSSSDRHALLSGASDQDHAPLVATCTSTSTSTCSPDLTPIVSSPLLGGARAVARGRGEARQAEAGGPT
mmetsp:Transcript_6817/g.22523  ORF Transcript_6817/g.22523 Transcript_6817/m.22523 type:complete len:137 (+) Transcript_6817:1145-1555(+)